MKVFLTIYGWLGIVFFCSFFTDDHWTDPNENLWTKVYQQQDGALDFSLNMKSFPNISESSWIELQVTNNTSHPIQITNAHYKLELHAYDLYGELITEGFFSSSDPSEIFPLNESINPFDLPELPSGDLFESERISALCTTLLGVPNNIKYEVQGKFEFFLEINDGQRQQIRIRDFPLSFSWWAPRKAELAILLSDLRAELKAPSADGLASTKLLAKLDMPDIEQQISDEEVLKALDLRQNYRDGRPAIARFMAEHYSRKEAIADYYQTALINRDHRIIADLMQNPSLLKRKHHDALLAWIPSAGASTKFRLLKILHQHRNAILTENISVSLSAHIQELYGDLLLVRPNELTKRELVSWAAAVEMWSYTGDPEAIQYIQPFLKNHSKILESALLMDTNSTSIPKARRVDEFAMESILRIQGATLFEFYTEKGFAPPYLDGTAEMQIATIRKQVIRDYKTTIALP